MISGILFQLFATVLAGLLMASGITGFYDLPSQIATVPQAAQPDSALLRPAQASGPAENNATSLAPPPGYTVQETIHVPVDGNDAAVSATTLAAGANYKLRASGTMVTGGTGVLRTFGDAEYTFSQLRPQKENTCGSPAVDVGIGVNDTTNGASKIPNWGPYDGSHVYTIDFTGQGGPLIFNYHDCNYGGNSGSLTVEILAPVVAPAGVPKLVNFEDLANGAHVFNQYPSLLFVGGNTTNSSDGSPTVTIVRPAQGTISPQQALQSHFIFACEFCGTSMTLQFAVAQHRVSLSTGLAESFESGSGATVRLEGFAGDPAQPGAMPIVQNTAACLGQAPTPVTTPLEIDDALARIKYARLSIRACDAPDEPTSGPSSGIILLDNLLYDRALNPPPGEHVPPIVTILTPPNNQTVTGDFPGQLSLAVSAHVTETALYSMTAQLNGATPVLMTFFLSGTNSYQAYAAMDGASGLISGTNKLVVRARDFDNPQNIGNATVTFTYQTKQMPPPTQLDIAPTAYEVTQAIDRGPQMLQSYQLTLEGYEVHVQDPPLVQGKPTLVRIYAAVSGSPNTSVDHVPAVMDVNGEKCQCVVARGLPPMTLATKPNYDGLSVPAFGQQGSDPFYAANRIYLSWNFLIQPDWTDQDLELTIQVNDGNYNGLPTRPSITECTSPIAGHCANNNQIKLHLHFEKELSVGIVPVIIHVTGSYQGHDYKDVKPSTGQVDYIFQQLNDLFPFPVQRDWTVDITVSPDISKDDLLSKIRDQYGWSWCMYATTGDLLFLGIFPGDQGDFAANEHNPDGSFVAGYATNGKPFCSAPGAWANADHAIDAAHELMHNFGFDHWACENGVTDDECSVFPIPHGGIGGWGFYFSQWRIIAPGDNSSNSTPHAHDVMSYGQLCSLYGGGPGCDTGEWISWYDYGILIDHHNLLDTYDANDPPALLVGGHISSTAVATFRPAYRIGTTMPFSDSIVEDDSGALYTMQGYDAAGNTLFVHNFEPVKLDVHTADYGKVLLFDEVVPLLPNLQQITLFKGSDVLGSITNPAPNQSPSVTITAPLAGSVWPAGSTQTIAWTASSPAHLPLTAIVEYSADGGKTRIALGRDIAGGSLKVNTDQLPGSANAFVYVEVSDGMNTAATQAGPFTVAAKPPVVHIVLPATKSQVSAHVPLLLQGTAFDRQESLNDAQFKWSSNRDGALGSGRELSTQKLSAGTHTLTLTVTDSAGRSGQDHVQLTVLPPFHIYLPGVAERSSR